MFTKSDIRLCCFLWVVVSGTVASAGSLREAVLREAAVEAGMVPAEATHIDVSPELAAVGRLLFQSKKMSLDRETACATCHIDRFGSGDGIPNAIGTKGRGEGVERLLGGGDIIPRNALPFWGRGGKGFDVFFWDGKVDASTGILKSQFAGKEPSGDALAVAVHLPPVEVGEMVTNSLENDRLEAETVEAATKVYEELLLRIQADSEIAPKLAAAKGISIADLDFVDIADAIAGFIRDNFAIQSTRFHEFVFSDGNLEPAEITGGLIFYGKGRCATCHNGAYFSDLQFHSVPFPQTGFGKNGFGVDYGRFNVTMDDRDRHRFRTPPLYNVVKTAPYSHSGSIVELGNAIRAHTDPLSIYDPTLLSAVQRVEFYERLKAWSDEPVYGVYLDDGEISSLISFLGTLSYESKVRVEVTD